MAIDPRISLQLRPLNLAQPLQIFNQAMAQAKQNQLLPGALQLQQQQVESGQQALEAGRLNLQSAKDKQDLKSIAEFSLLNQDALNKATQGDTMALQTALASRGRDLLNQGRDASQTFEALQMIQQGDTQGAVSSLKNAEVLAQNVGLLGQSQLTAGQRDRSALVKELEGATTESGMLKPIEQLTAKQKLAAVEGGLIPRAAISAQERIASTPELTTAVAESQAQITGATEGSKLDVKARKLPSIESAVQKAKAMAKEQGLAFTDLNRSKAALPSLTKTIDELKMLAPIATSTLAGRGFDALSKELGFGATKGSTARTKFTALIQNQILPLLKPTFGGNTSDNELNQLKLTLADPNDAPENKIAALDAFLDQQKLKIESQERELSGIQEQQSQVLRFDAQGNLIQ